MYYSKSVDCIAFLIIDFCINDGSCDMIHITDKKLLHFKLSKSGQILRVDKTCFSKPSQYVTGFEKTRGFHAQL